MKKTSKSKSELYLGIAGSYNIIDVLVYDNKTSKFVMSERFPGMQVRVSPWEVQKRLFSEIGTTIPQRLGISQSEFLDGCQKISLAVSGTDNRFDNNRLLGAIRATGFKNIGEDDFYVHGIAEAAFRGAMGNTPGIIVRSGNGCSIYASNDSETELNSAWVKPLGARGTVSEIGRKVFETMEIECDECANSEELQIAQAAKRELGIKSIISLIDDLSIEQSVSGDIAYRRPLQQILQIVFQLAREGNTKAAEILDETRDYLWRKADYTINKLCLNNSVFHVLFQGTILEAHPSMAKRLMNDIKYKYSNAKYIDCNKKYFSRAVGALKLIWSPKRNTQRYLYAESSEIKSLEDQLRNSMQQYNKSIYWQPIRLDI